MIEKINQSNVLGITNNYSQLQKKNKIQNTNMQNPILNDKETRVFPKSYITFGSATKSTEQKMKEIKDASTDEALDTLLTAEGVAREYGDKKVDERHLFAANLLSTLEFIEKIEDARQNPQAQNASELKSENAGVFASILDKNIFSDINALGNLKVAIAKELQNIDNEMEAEKGEIKPLDEKQKVTYDEEIADKIYQNYMAAKESYGNTKIKLPASFFIQSTMNIGKTETGKGYITQGLERITADFKANDKAIERTFDENSVHLSAFDAKAKKVLKNLSLGVNMFVLSDNDAKSDYLINSINYVMQDSESLDKGKLNSSNATLTVLDNVDSQKIANTAKKLAEDTSKTHIIVYNQDELVDKETKVDASGMGSWSPTEEFYEMVQNPPKNIKFIALQQKETYYGDMKSPMISNMFSNFGDTSLPMLSPTQVKEAFKEQPILLKDIEKDFTPEAMDKAIEAAALLDGEFPEKAQNLMKKLSIYYIDKPEITVEDVSAYMDEAKTLFKGASDDGKIQVIFNTGKNISQFLGKEATKHEAQLIVKEIKANTLGTKGMLIYSADDTVGAGRRFTAQAIAGEVKAPYVEINAMDFTIKENPMTGQAKYPDDDIKKMFSMLRAQADANADKAAVLYIDNFEYFMAGEEISSRYMNLMPLIQREIKNANDKGLNILILGSISNSRIAGSTLAQSSGFSEAISVDTPAFDIKAREKIVDKALTDYKLKVAGGEAEKANFLKYASQITEYFSYNDLNSLIKKTRSVAIEREHAEITNEDLVEGYLQLTTGRLAANNMPDYEKRLVASHECGHATNLEVMRNLALDTQIPWRSPEKVNFVTLDPRGWYGGAVYFSSKVENPEMSFEKMFADVVCSYGGHSAEKKFFGMDGSYGITADLESATQTANRAVMLMGQGAHTGKLSVNGMLLTPSEEQKEIMRKDVDAIMENALIISDDITEEYEDFNNKFADKYGKLVGTGSCIVLGEVFRKELAEWIKNQTPEKKEALQKLNEKILDVIEYSKKGLKYSVSKLSSNDWYKTL